MFFPLSITTAMNDHQKPSKATVTQHPHSSDKSPAEFRNGDSHPRSNTASSEFSGHKIRYPNPPESAKPDPATLREQWKFAIRQYSRWYSHAWGTAILAGGAFFALGWLIKGGNPLPSLQGDVQAPPSSNAPSSSSDKKEVTA